MSKVMYIDTGKGGIVHPIDSRYRVKEMNAIWEEENQLRTMLSVEVALAKTISEMRPDLISKKEAQSVETGMKKVELERVKEIESKIHHDVMAIVKALDEKSDCRAIHLGATSADITHTANALLIRQSLDLLLKDAKTLRKSVAMKAKQTRDLVCVDRTHGQHAVPTTYGYKFAGFADQLDTAIARMEKDRELITGKMAGAVGTGNSFRELGINGIALEKKVMNRLKLKPAKHSRQTPPRDNWNYLFADIAIYGTILEKMARDFWDLNRTEIGEVHEALSKDQVGSSTMPHKRNPFKFERVMGFASLLRGDLLTELELGFSHARDLKHSATDRCIIPEMFIIACHMTRLMENQVSQLYIDKKRVKENLEYTRGCILAERAMTALAKKMNRQKAHELVKKLAWKAWSERKPLLELLNRDKLVRKHLSEKELNGLMDYSTYVGYAKQKARNIVS